MEKQMKTQNIPQTDSIEELAKFWDTHELTDFEDQMEEVTAHIFERKKETVLEIHLKPNEVEAVKNIAKSKGVGNESLIREWVLEKLHTS